MTARKTKTIEEQIKRIADMALQYATDIVTYLLPNGERRAHEYVCGNIHGDAGDSLSINLQTGEWADFADDRSRGTDLISLWATIKGIKQLDAALAISQRYGFNYHKPTYKKKNSTENKSESSNHFCPLIAPPGCDPTYHDPDKRWAYRDENGSLLMYIDRFDLEDGSKELKPLTFGVFGRKTGWHRKIIPTDRPLFNLHKIAARPDAPILIVEGEKTACAADMMFPDYVVATWAGGSKAVTKTNWATIANRQVTIWPDHDEPGRDAADAIANRLWVIRKSKHLSHDEYLTKIVDIPTEWPEGWDLADEPPISSMTPTDYRRMVSEAKPARIIEPRAFDSPEQILEEFNSVHAVVSVGGTMSILWELTDPVTHRSMIQYLNERDFSLLYRDRQVEIREPERTKYEPAAKWWLQHTQRRKYHQITFAPQQEVPSDVYNLWKGLAYEPHDGDCSLFIKHINDNICGGNEYLTNWVLCWMADAVQNPANRPGTAIVLRGKQGTGKGVFCHQFGSLFGQHFLYVNNTRHFLGHFNSHLADCLILYADEAFWAGDKQSEGVLKGLVTEPRIVIEYKHRNPVSLPSYIRLMMSSNSDWVVPAGLEERRFCVLDVADDHMQDHNYFRAIIDQMEKHGGREALLHGLMQIDTSAIDIMSIPSTKALNDQKILSMDSATRFWFERLEEGVICPSHSDWEVMVKCEDVYEHYVSSCKQMGERRPLQRSAFGKRLLNVCPGLKKDRVSMNRFREYSSERVYVYLIPDLEECRNEFARIAGIDVAQHAELLI